jgi:coatomer protein complex subunit gamma
VTSIPTTLKFLVKDCDPVTGEPDSDEGYDDDYQLEDIDVAVSDYVMRAMKVLFNIFIGGSSQSSFFLFENVLDFY